MVCFQAQARCHRIGQSKAVKVYRLITRNSYEREMFDKASLKLGLDKAVLQSMGGEKGVNTVSVWPCCASVALYCTLCVFQCQRSSLQDSEDLSWHATVGCMCGCLFYPVCVSMPEKFFTGQWEPDSENLTWYTTVGCLLHSVCCIVQEKSHAGQWGSVLLSMQL